MPDSTAVAAFIERWSASGGNELANSQPFLKDLCTLLGLEHPEPARSTNESNAYCFERKVHVPIGGGKTELKRLDLYKRGCFVLESKQGQEVVTKTPLSLPMQGLTKSSAVKRGSRAWEDTMARAKRQAEQYVRVLPVAEGRPPFIIVADVGFCFDIYAEFSCTGGIYIPFPDQRTSRIKLEDLAREEVQDFFRALWIDPFSLDPSRRAARVTTEIADYLAKLASALEAAGHAPEKVAAFLIRCLFTMFAEDVGLLPANSFQDILSRAAGKPELFPPLVHDLWTAMNAGEVSVALGEKLRRFNGNVFALPEALALSGEHIAILLAAAKADWREVEPAIFGTLLERALTTRDRHKLGAHYTPRAYVERLVLPTVIYPLRADWHDVQGAAKLLADQGKLPEAQAEILAFLDRLRSVRVLDPACGSGNFLYVTLEHMKRLESEVEAEAKSYGAYQGKLQDVDPHQFLGLEINPRAAHIAEMVLWIGYWQWFYRTHGKMEEPQEPIIRSFHNIECRDAVLEYDKFRTATDGHGKAISRWDGHTMKVDPVTGRDVPDESAQVEELVYEKPRPASWPEADFIVGNPPFIGGGMKRAALGSGYFDALAKCYTDLPEACDFVMYWWHKAASIVRGGKSARRFGFITTNSLGQVFNRRVTALHLAATPPLSLAFAVPDHPWVDAAGGAAVRISMTVGVPGTLDGTLASVVSETPTDGPEMHVTFAEQVGRINADLTIGADVAGAVPLTANEDLSCPGVKLHGAGFIVTPKEAAALGLGRIPGLEAHIRPYRHGRDLADKPRGVLVIDLLGLAENDVRERYPEVYQWVLERVKPERDVNASRSKDSAQYAAKWWLFGKPRETLRPALAGLPRYISTSETAKHRFFVFLDATILPDNMLVNIASADAFDLGILSSRIHVSWALTAGGRLGVGNDPRYNKSRCFETFPFPDPTPELKERIRDLGERLDAHRKARQALHPDVTLTGMYNVLEALRAGRELTAKERDIHEKGLVAILRQLHDELDAAVAQAYGWPADLPEADILARLVALNHERAEEEKSGIVRWLRPEYQCRDKTKPVKQAKLGIETPAKPTKKGKTPKRAPKVTPILWPTSLPEQFQAVRSVLASLGGTATAEQVARSYARAPRAKVQEILETLAAQGFVSSDTDKTYHIN
ncbi:class I SAM-dependent DNA methyltransferase [Humidesulfovibrio idahonensis]